MNRFVSFKFPPHEGFLCAASSFYKSSLRWNSTVDGQIFASDPKTNKIIEVWKLSNYPQLPRGWTRGLCILHDGILVGSTCMRQTADVWMKRHGNEWNFDIKSSKTSVSFIPFKRSSGTSETCNVNILNERSAKIFSLLVTPDV